MARPILPGLAAALLLAGCAFAPTPEAAPNPAPAPSLCDEGWTPPPTETETEMSASLRAFSERWLERLREGAAHVHGASRAIRAGFEVRLLRTATPIVGALRYCEEAIQCEVESTCRATSRTIVTEIFRHDGSDWVY